MFRRTMIGPLLGAVLVAAGLFVVSGTPGLGLPTASSTPTQTGPGTGLGGSGPPGSAGAGAQRVRVYDVAGNVWELRPTGTNEN